jgi:hypothetical protein
MYKTVLIAINRPWMSLGFESVRFVGGGIDGSTKVRLTALEDVDAGGAREFSPRRGG